MLFACPGCGCAHGVHVDVASAAAEGSPVWSLTWTDDGEPTLSPSVLVRWGMGADRPPRICHSFVVAGKISFLADSTHALAGQTVPIPDFDSFT